MLDLYYWDIGHYFTSLEPIILISTFMHCSQFSGHHNTQQFIHLLPPPIHTQTWTYIVYKHHVGTMKHSCRYTWTCDTNKFSKFLILMQLLLSLSMSVIIYMCRIPQALIYNHLISSPIFLLLHPFWIYIFFLPMPLFLDINSFIQIYHSTLYLSTYIFIRSKSSYFFSFPILNY